MAGDRETANQVRLDYAQEWALRGPVKGAEKALSRFRKQRRAHLANRSFDADRRREMIERVEERMEKVIRRILALHNRRLRADRG